MAVTYLNVEFREKDIARSLGARWDATVKQWYIPLECDPSPFAKWLPNYVAPTLTAKTMAATYSTLSQLLARVAQAVARTTPQAEWVKAEISEFRPTKNGHIHLDLIELDANKNLLGKASGKLFKIQADTLLEKFFSITQSQLGPGMKVLLQVRAQFHIQYGFSLIIEDIDPAYTLGDISAKLAHIRETLQQEGVFTNNKALSPPREFYRLAVLSPQSAAGLGDFKQEADLLARHHLCHFVYYHGQFQGEVASVEICTALQQILGDHQRQPFDALVIIRGGGAVIDLAWLNDLAIARALCLAPLPVFVGIGHERDHTILDEVAQSYFDTPSKVIAHIFSTIVHNAKQAQVNSRTIHQAISHILQHQRLSAEQYHVQIHHYLQQTLALKAKDLMTQYQSLVTTLYYRLDKLMVLITQLHSQIVVTVKHAIQRCQQTIHHALTSIYATAPTVYTLADTQVKQLMQHIQAIPQNQVALLAQQSHSYFEQILNAMSSACYYYQQECKRLLLHSVSLGPEATLKRGFVLALDAQGNALSSKQMAAEQAYFKLTFHDGTLVVQPISQD